MCVAKSNTPEYLRKNSKSLLLHGVAAGRQDEVLQLQNAGGLNQTGDEGASFSFCSDRPAALPHPAESSIESQVEELRKAEEG